MATLQPTNTPYKFVECTKQNLDTFPITEGCVYFTDTGEIYIDEGGKRKPYGISEEESRRLTDFLYNDIHKVNPIWVQGNLENGTAVTTPLNRIRTGFIPISGANKIKYSCQNGYSINIIFYKEKELNSYMGLSNWMQGSGEYEGREDAKYICLTGKKNDESTIKPIDGANLSLSIFGNNYTEDIFSKINSYFYLSSNANFELYYNNGRCFFESTTPSQSFVMYTPNGKPYTVTSFAKVAEELGNYAIIKEDGNIKIEIPTDRALVFNTLNQKYEFIIIKELKSNHIPLLYSTWNNANGIIANIYSHKKVDKISDEIEGIKAGIGLNMYHPDKIKEFTSLFNESSDIESFLFMTDPHILGYGRNEKDFLEGMDKIKRVYEKAPVSFFLCGGDWLSAHVKNDAKYKLGIIDGYMRKTFSPYVPLLGNHDTNYQGEDWHGILTQNTIDNLFFREEGSAYYKYQTKKSLIYCFNSGTDLTPAIPLEYKQKEVDWFAKSLKSDDFKHSFVALHISESLNETIPDLTNDITNIINAYNNRTTITLNNIQYDFATCNGKCHFIISGHLHKDKIITINGVPCLITTNLHNDENPSQEPTYDLIYVDYDNSILKTVRVGTGVNREMNIL